jgi:hypothetical protein
MMSQFEPEGTFLERERTILEKIHQNPKLHHNALIKLMVPKYMAKTTFEKTKNHMVEKNVLSVTKRGNKKFYSITENYHQKSLQTVERISHEKYQHLQHEIKRMEDYSHKDVNEKISTSVQLLRELLQTDNGFTLLDAVKNPKKTLYKDEHLAIQEMISKVFDMVLEDQDFELIYPVVMKNVEIDTSNNF